MKVHVLVVVGTSTVESIQVELTSETGKLGLIKVNAHDFANKFLLIVNLKGPAIVGPRDNVSKVHALGVVQQLVQFGGEEGALVVVIVVIVVLGRRGSIGSLGFGSLEWILNNVTTMGMHVFLKASLQLVEHEMIIMGQVIVTRDTWKARASKRKRLKVVVVVVVMMMMMLVDVIGSGFIIHLSKSSIDGIHVTTVHFEQVVINAGHGSSSNIIVLAAVAHYCHHGRRRSNWLRNHLSSRCCLHSGGGSRKSRSLLMTANVLAHGWILTRKARMLVSSSVPSSTNSLESIN
mmetsp:Transcript_5207/g.12460  ORF Transcript_5207/g.12460 Transcript_5207/m.12460 type:complete len:291 (-) Transcript_5207:491-1363(-)